MKKYHYVSSFNINVSCLNAELVRVMHKAGKRVKVWTPDAPCDVPSLLVDGVITDYPWRWPLE
jgi:glycerophosphoryl diester phosphodiesterase